MSHTSSDHGPRTAGGRGRLRGRPSPKRPGRLRLASSVLALTLLGACVQASSRPHTEERAATEGTVVAFVSDFGNCDAGQRATAAMVDSWEADAVVTGGDNTQGEEGCRPYEDSVEPFFGEYYADPAKPRFWPALGNHDYDNETAGLAAYTRAFPHLPTDADPQGRWYETTVGDLTFFVLDSEASGRDLTAQRRWIDEALASARSEHPERWRVVVVHRPPHSSGVHGGWAPMRAAAGWVLADWGADLVLSGHQHVYEDVVRDGLHHVTATTGASELTRTCGADRVTGSRVCIEGTGALRLTATPTVLRLELRLVDPDGGAPRTADRLTLRR